MEPPSTGRTISRGSSNVADRERPKSWAGPVQACAIPTIEYCLDVQWSWRLWAEYTLRKQDKSCNVLPTGMWKMSSQPRATHGSGESTPTTMLSSPRYETCGCNTLVPGRLFPALRGTRKEHVFPGPLLLLPRILLIKPQPSCPVPQSSQISACMIPLSFLRGCCSTRYNPKNTKSRQYTIIVYFAVPRLYRRKMLTSARPAQGRARTAGSGGVLRRA